MLLMWLIHRGIKILLGGGGEVTRYLRTSLAPRPPLSNGTHARKPHLFRLSKRILASRNIRTPAGTHGWSSWMRSYKRNHCQDREMKQKSYSGLRNIGIGQLKSGKNVLWTDESKFEVFGCKRRAYVFKRLEEKMIPDCIVTTVKHGGRSITVWRCIGANSVDDLIKIEGILKKEQYLSILRDHAIPSARRLIGQNFVFLHNNDPKHAARVCKDYFQHLEQSDESK